MDADLKDEVGQKFALGRRLLFSVARDTKIWKYTISLKLYALWFLQACTLPCFGDDTKSDYREYLDAIVRGYLHCTGALYVVNRPDSLPKLLIRVLHAEAYMWPGFNREFSPIPLEAFQDRETGRSIPPLEHTGNPIGLDEYEPGGAGKGFQRRPPKEGGCIKLRREMTNR
jgi:hypothetical protein